MKKVDLCLKSLIAITLAAASFAPLTGNAKQNNTSSAHTLEGNIKMSQQKQQVLALLKAIETGETAPVAAINAQNYTQHNTAVADGLAGFGQALAALPKGSARVNTVRVYQDGNYVFAHTDYNFFGPKIGFDIFRFENNKIVEHWDNLQITPTVANPAGHSMIDGPTNAQHLSATKENKMLVQQFVDDILVNGRMDKLQGYFNGDNYIQHNPQIGDGLSGLGHALEAMAKAGITMKYDRVHKVLGEGDMVLTVSQGTLGGKATAFYDLFRVKNGKIAEHWDTIETIMPQNEWKNDNGKFNFPK